MIRDEQDMLREALDNHTKFCDLIFVLDGTEGPDGELSESICRSYSQVVGYWRDRDTGYDKIVCGSRQFLLERARETVGLNHWCVILHGDEIWGTSPLDLMTPTNEPLAYRVRFYHFFPHVSQRESWDFGEKTIEECSKWYMLPATLEKRVFFDIGLDYNPNLHLNPFPIDVDVRQSELVVKSYNYRTPEQAHKRAVSRKETGWQTNHYAHLLAGPDEFFVASLAQDGMKWSGWSKPGEGEAVNTDDVPLPMMV